MVIGFGFKRAVAAAIVALGTVGVGATAEAAPGVNVGGTELRALSPAVQSVHWEWHHHHRVWVPDYHRHYYR